MSEQLAKSYYLRALQLWKLGDLEQAESQVKQVLSYQPNHEAALLLLSNIYFKKKVYHSAEQVLLRLLKNQPKNVEALTNYGLVLLASNRLPEAEEVFKKALQESPQNSAEIYFHLGNIAKLQLKTSEAQRYYQRVLKEKPDFTAATLALIQILEPLNEEHLIESLVREGLKYDPNNPYLLNYYGQFSLKNGDFEGAVTSLTNALRLKPDWPNALNNLGLAYFKLGRTTEAMRIYQDVIRVEPNNLEAKANLALLLKNTGNVQEAEKLLHQVLEKDFKQPTAILAISRIYFERQDVQRAAEILNRYLELDPDHPQVRLESGKMNLYLGNFERAEKDLLFNINLQGDSIEALRALANLYMRTHRVNLISKVQTRLQRLDPNNFENYRDLAMYFEEVGNLKNATEALDYFCKKQPHDISSLLKLGELYYRAKNLNAAVNAYERVRELDPKNITALNSLSKIYQELGDNKKALELSELILQSQDAAVQNIDELINTLDVYENAVTDMSKDLSDHWKKNLRTLNQTEEPTPQEHVEQNTIEREDNNWMFAKDDGESLSLLDMPDLNPAIVMDEEEQVLKIRDEDEILHYEDDDEEEEDPLVVNTAGGPGGGQGGSSTAPASGLPAGGAPIATSPQSSLASSPSPTHPEAFPTSTPQTIAPSNKSPVQPTYQEALGASPFTGLEQPPNQAPPPSYKPPSAYPQAPSSYQPPPQPPSYQTPPQASYPQAPSSYQPPPQPPSYQPPPQASYPQAPSYQPPPQMPYPQAPPPPPPNYSMSPQMPYPQGLPPQQPYSSPTPPGDFDKAPAPPSAYPRNDFNRRYPPNLYNEPKRGNPSPPRRPPANMVPEPELANEEVKADENKALGEKPKLDDSTKNELKEDMGTDTAPKLTEEDLEDGLEALMRPDFGRGSDDLTNPTDLESVDLEDSWSDVGLPDWEDEEKPGSFDDSSLLNDDDFLNEPLENLDSVAEEVKTDSTTAPQKQGSESSPTEPLLVDSFPETFSDDPKEAPPVFDDFEALEENNRTKQKKIVPTADRIAQLMDYLGSLTNYLPPDKKLQLFNDHIPLKIERIKLNLKSKKVAAAPNAADARRKVRELIDKVKENLK